MTNRETYINTPFLRKLNHILMVKFTFTPGFWISGHHQMGWKWYHDRYFGLSQDRELDSSKIFSSFKIWEFCSTAKFVRIQENEEEELPQVPTRRLSERKLSVFYKIKKKIQKFLPPWYSWPGKSPKYQQFCLLRTI